jgi:hypothetical protein
MFWNWVLGMQMQFHYPLVCATAQNSGMWIIFFWLGILSQCSKFSKCCSPLYCIDGDQNICLATKFLKIFLSPGWPSLNLHIAAWPMTLSVCFPYHVICETVFPICTRNLMFTCFSNCDTLVHQIMEIKKNSWTEQTLVPFMLLPH